MSRKTKSGAPKPDSPQAIKGLMDNLFPAKEGEREPEVASTAFRMISPDLIEVGSNVRRTINEDERADMRASIAEMRGIGEGIEGSGIIQALLVRAQEGSEKPYRLVYGQKRLVASVDLELPEVPCIIDHRSDKEMAAGGYGEADALVRLMQLTENGQRSDPPPLEQAEAIEATMKDMKLSVRDAGRLLGKNKSYVESHLRLLKAKPDVKRMVSFRKDTLKHAYYIEQVKDDTLRDSLITAVIEEEISAKEVKRRIDEANTPNPIPSAQIKIRGFDTANTGGSKTDTSPRSEVSGAGIGAEHNGQASSNSPQSNTSPDVIENSIVPAKNLLTEAVRALDEMRITAPYRKKVLREIEVLETRIAEIRARVKS